MNVPRCPCLCDTELSSLGYYKPYARCPRCGSGWTDIAPGEHWDEGSPSAEQMDFWGSRQSQWVTATQGKSAGRVLDVGCGYSHFVEWCAEQGWDAWGTEPSENARARGVHRAATVVADLDAVPGLFDLITLWDVLEHVPAPRSLVTELKARLAPGGRLFVCSPDFNALRVRWPLLKRRPEQFFNVVKPTEHCTQFTAKGLTLLLQRCELVQVERVRPPMARGPRAFRGVLGAAPLVRQGLFVVGRRSVS